MFVLIVGGGKVGLNTARQLMRLGHEIVLVEQRSTRFNIIAEELGDEALVFGDGTEVWVLEKAGIGRCDMVVAVTGDDEDNIIISQVVQAEVRRAQGRRPRQQPVQPADVRPARRRGHHLRHHGAAQPDHARAAGAQVRAPALAAGSRTWTWSSSRSATPRRSRNTYVQDIDLPEGALLAAIVRAGKALVARGSTEILPGDYVLCLLPPGKERDLIKVFLPDEEPERVLLQSELDTSEG